MASQQGQKGYITDMLTEADEPDLRSSEIVKFYAGNNILITGASGFLGRLLVEKILRSCPGVAKVYMLMRAKKGKTPEVRFQEYFGDAIFARLNHEQPKYASKVVLIEGDVSEIGLGLSPENRKLLSNTNIILHGAATVRFDESFRTAVNINVRGTRELVLLAKELTDLKAFVHISTAYSHCVIDEIDEKFYTSPMTPEQIMTLVDTLDEETLDQTTSTLLGKWPNTYSFTKAVAEDVVRYQCSGIPACIVRPSIVIGTSKEPVAGWVNNFYGPTGIAAGVAIGLLRTLHCDENLVADVIPADYVISLIIAAGWDIAKTQRMNRNEADSVPEPEEAKGIVPPIFNAVSSCQKPNTWREYMQINIKHGLKIMPVVSLWCIMFSMTKYLWVYKIQVFLLHIVPAFIVDCLAYLTGRKPSLMDAYAKIHKFSKVISFFTMKQWKFYNQNVIALWERINEADRIIFDFNLDRLDWDEYYYHHIRGIRVYLLKDPLETISAGNARYRKLKIAHFILVSILSLVFLWVFTSILRAVGLWW